MTAAVQVDRPAPVPASPRPAARRPGPQLHEIFLRVEPVAEAFSGAFASLYRRLKAYPGHVARSIPAAEDLAAANRILSNSIDRTLDVFRAGLIRPNAPPARSPLQDDFDGWVHARLQDAIKENGARYVTVAQMRDIGYEFVKQLYDTLRLRLGSAIAESVLGDNYLMRYYPIEKAMGNVEADLARFCRKY